METKGDSVPNSHSSGRSHRFNVTAIASLLSRGISISIAFISTPLLIRYLGKEQYGGWLVILTATGLISFADLGIGNSLINETAENLANERHEETRKAISNAFFFLCTASILVLATTVVGFEYAPLASNIVPSTAQADLYAPVFLATLALWVVAIPFSVVQKVQMGSHQGYIAQVWGAAGSVLSLAALVIAIHTNQTFLVIAACASSGPLAAALGNWIIFFRFQRRELCPRITDVNMSLIRPLIGAGFFFLILQIASTVVFSLDNLILAHFFGASVVAEYSVVFRLFQIPTIISGMWFSPLWPAYTAALATHDVAWVRKTVVKSLQLSTLLTIGTALLLIFFAVPIVRLWTGLEVTPSLSLLLAFGCTAVVVVSTSSISVYLLASKFVRGHGILAIVHACVSLGLALTLPRVLGPAGVAWSTVLGYVLVIIPAFLWIVPRLLRRQMETETFELS